VDWLWLNGTTAIKTAQRLLNLKPDGIVGEKTLAAINNYPDQQELFERFKTERVAYIERICASRPANRRFKKGWLNRLNDIKFAFAVLVCFFLTCFLGCKSVASTESVHAKTETGLHSETKSEQQIKTLQDAIFTKQSNSLEDTEMLIETFIVKFDTGLQDSIAGKHPVKEMSRTRVSRGKILQSSMLEKQETHRTDSAIIHSQETIDLKSTENIQIRKFKVSQSQLRLYGSITLIFLLAAIGWIFRKKITDFFCLFRKK